MSNINTFLASLPGKICMGISLSCGLLTLGYYLFKNSIQSEAKNVVTNIVVSKKVRIATKEYVTAMMKDDEIKVMVNEFLMSVISNRDVQKSIKEYLIETLNDAEIKIMVNNFLISTLKNINVKERLYDILKEVVVDEAIEKIIVDYLSKVAMASLDTPVNSEYIRDKVIETITSSEVMESVTASLIEVIERDSVKKIIGDNAIDALSQALKKHFPKSFGLMV